MRRIITATVKDSSGVLNRVTGLLSKRGFNISSITVGASEMPYISKMTFEVDINTPVQAEQIIKQLNKQIDVIKVMDITDLQIVARELALIKIATNPTNRHEIYGIINPFRARVLDVAKNSITIEATGKTDKVDAIIDLLSPYGIKELSRTGITAFPRGRNK
ncbi:acetolactate synthase small subunit [Jeotgalibaca sp. A122]|uniref:acetolactate synthase small subunit n=1 Tax=Jeotgalibaca sp. A122 TaxID=3457322 RepID=UPI003FD68341